MKRLMTLFAACLFGVLVLTMPTSAAPNTGSPTTHLAGRSSLGHKSLPSRPHAPGNKSPLGPIGLLWDDGSAEDSLGWGNSANNYTAAAIWLNHFDIIGYPRPVRLTSFQILWPGQSAADLIGRQVRLVAYLDTDADGDPSNANLLTSATNTLVTVTINDGATFETYPVDYTITAPGDIYVGWEDAWAEQGVSPFMFPAAIDTTTPHGNSWVAANTSCCAPNITSLGANNVLGTIDSLGYAGNWMVRAIGTFQDPATPTPAATATPIPPRCPGERFTDVCPGDYFYSPVLRLNDAGIISGYNTAPPCDNSLGIPCFKPYNNITRGQAAKIIALSANLPHNLSGAPHFTDVPGSNPFYDFIEYAFNAGVINGYPCGSQAEPCDSQNRPYFRPGSDVTRGQLSKMVSTAFGYSDPVTGQTFEDVPPASTFYTWVERIAARAIIGGYPCGTTPLEPCVGPNNRPYFRPNNNITRGQAAKIIDGAIIAQPTATPTAAVTPTSTAIPTGTATATATATP